MRRDYPDRPIVGVGAVILEDDQVVLVRRGTPPSYGAWSLPGGAVELGETMEQAVIREVAEEVGLDVVVEDVVAVLERVFLDSAEKVQYHYVLVDFLCRPVGGSLRASGDALSCRRVPLASLEGYPLSRETREVIERAWDCRGGKSSGIYMRTKVSRDSKKPLTRSGNYR
jgi:8-oxo-dGTP diphosphatase